MSGSVPAGTGSADAEAMAASETRGMSSPSPSQPDPAGALLDIERARENANYARELDAAESKLEAAMQRLLLADWGDEHPYNCSLVQQYLKDHPRVVDELVGINDAQRLRTRYHELAVLARGGGSAAPKMTPDEELSALRKRMREDRRGWFKDLKAQARYRDLLRGIEEKN